MPPLCAPAARAWSRERHQIAKALRCISVGTVRRRKSIRYFVVLLIGYFAVADRERKEPRVGLVSAPLGLPSTISREAIKNIQSCKNISANDLGTTSKQSRSVDPRPEIAGSSPGFRELGSDR